MLNVAIWMLALSGMLIITSVILFYIWKIPTLVSDLSGKTSRQNIKKLQKINSSDEMSHTDLFNAMTSGALDDHDLEDRNEVRGDAHGGLSGVLSTITLEEEKRGGRRRKGATRGNTGGFGSTEGIASERPTGGLSTGLLGTREEVILESLDFPEDISTGYFVDEEQVVGLDTPIGAFSSSRVVLVTREFSSLN